MQLEDQVLISTGVESGSETGVAGDKCSWWHCNCCLSDCVLPEKRETLFLSTLSHPQMFWAPFWWQAVPTFTHLHPQAKENDPSPKWQGWTPFLAISPLFLCPLRLDLILFLSDPQIDENLSSSPSMPEPPDCVAWAAPVRALPTATAERGVIYIFIRNSVLLASDFNSDK